MPLKLIALFLALATQALAQPTLNWQSYTDEKSFTQAVQTTFPTGSSYQAAQSWLLEQGFKANPSSNPATHIFSWASKGSLIPFRFSCEWTIAFTTAEDTITTSTGAYGCRGL